MYPSSPTPVASRGRELAPSSGNRLASASSRLTDNIVQWRRAQGRSRRPAVGVNSMDYFDVSERQHNTPSDELPSSNHGTLQHPSFLSGSQIGVTGTRKPNLPSQRHSIHTEPSQLPGDRPPTPIRLSSSLRYEAVPVLEESESEEESESAWVNKRRPLTPIRLNPLPPAHKPADANYKQVDRAKPTRTAKQQSSLPPLQQPKPPRKRPRSARPTWDDPWGFAAVQPWLAGRVPRPFCSSSSEDTDCEPPPRPVNALPRLPRGPRPPARDATRSKQRERRDETASPLRFSPSPSRSSESDESHSLSVAKRETPTRTKRRLWRGARVLSALQNGTRLDITIGASDNSEEEEDERPSKRRRRSTLGGGRLTPVLSEAAQFTRAARIAHYAELEEYQLPTEVAWMSD